MSNLNIPHLLAAIVLIFATQACVGGHNKNQATTTTSESTGANISINQTVALSETGKCLADLHLEHVSPEPGTEIDKTNLGIPNAFQDYASLTIPYEVKGHADEKNYGFVPTQAITVGGSIATGAERAYGYLSRLRDLSGKPFIFSRLGSCCQTEWEYAQFDKYVMLDQYVLTDSNYVVQAVIYLNQYGPLDLPVYVPSCMKMAGSDTDASVDPTLVSETDIDNMMKDCDQQGGDDSSARSHCFMQTTSGICHKFNRTQDSMDQCMAGIFNSLNGSGTTAQPPINS